ncbi:MAG: DNA translocase FtsK [Bacteroidaceae bacterium]|nr:DNA translocase FtsK [Bacteroidaceae bacterium]
MMQAFKADTFQVVLGVISIMFAIYMIYIFISFLWAGAQDQSLVQHPIVFGMANLNNEISNHGGTLGARMSEFWINGCFGVAAFCIPVFLFVLGLKLVRAYSVSLIKWFVCLSVVMYWFSIALSFFCLTTGLFQNSFLRLGGNHGLFVSQWLNSQIGYPGVIIGLATIALIFFIYVSSETIRIIRNVLNPANIKKIPFTFSTPHNDQEEPTPSESENITTTPEINDTPASEAETTEIPQDEPIQQPIEEDPVVISLDPTVTEEENETEEENAAVIKKPSRKPLLTDPDFVEIKVAEQEEKAGTIDLKPYDPRLDLENYKFPTLNLLKDFGNQTVSIDYSEQNANKDRIIKVLRSFGVEIDSINATVGPTITLYEITPAEGVRISKIRNLEDDIALSLAALGIRIIAPIPGKGTIGIEVPNKKSQIVPMRDIVNSRKFQESNYELPVAIGKTITNEVFMVDLAKAPHMLVAGATGMGKSVGLNAIVTSLLYKKHPAELKFVIIDPKKVEFGIYAPIEKHFLAKLPDNEEAIITDVDKVVATLKSLCQEMDDRYDLLKNAGVRNIKEYNAKFIARKLRPDIEVPMTHKRDYPVYHHYMPYIVTIIDEFGDLIMTAGKEIETPICRLAQLARAIGIHCIIATQRPTTSIITGNIKANFPARVSFRVSAMMDSRTILDKSGAQQLIGRGDMLYLQGSDPVRVQCAFVDTPEVEAINEYIAKQQGYPSAFELHPVFEETEDANTPGEINLKELDPMFRDAATLVVTYQQGSTSLIQRKFAIGYNRAGRLMDQLERAGIVGPANGSKARDVLCISEEDLEMRLQNLGI